MSAMQISVPRKVLDELLQIDVKTRELLCCLNTSINPLEFGNGSPASLAAMEESEIGPDMIERLCERVTMTLQSIAARTRKFCDLNQPERRERTTRRSMREDSGIGSGYFGHVDDGDTPNSSSTPTSEVTVPIQESMEQTEGNTDQEVCSAVEHTDTSVTETSYL